MIVYEKILTEEARERGFVFCAEYGCTVVVPDNETADRQGWEKESYWYRGIRRRCPGPHHYAWDQQQRGTP